ncbi:hypothetical protein LTR11_004984 [Exophiala xenobiotica]|nr:hypothetical protein LTR11_004984 [Exophiala xenobiotica]
MLNYLAGDFHRSPTRSTNSIFGPSPSSPNPPSPPSRRLPTLRTPIVRHAGPWLRAAESPRRRRQPRIRSSPRPGPAPFYYRRAPSVESPCRMPSVSPLPLIKSYPPMPKVKAFSLAGPFVDPLYKGPTYQPKPRSPRRAFATPSPPRIKAFSRCGPFVPGYYPYGLGVDPEPRSPRRAFATPSPPRIKAFSRCGPFVPGYYPYGLGVDPEPRSPRRAFATPSPPRLKAFSKAASFVPWSPTVSPGVCRVRIVGPKLRRSGSATLTTTASSGSQTGDFDSDEAFLEDTSEIESPIRDSPTVPVISYRTQPSKALSSSSGGFFARCGEILDSAVNKVVTWVRSWF